MARPRKRFGQHFLEPAWVAKLVEAIAPHPEERFIEIGPGRGAITVPLAARADRVIAVEVDRDLAAALRVRGLPNVDVVTADVLRTDLAALADALRASAAAAGDTPIRIVGNLPYNISSPVLFQVLAASAATRFMDATLMLQEEVAERLVAPPGTAEYGVLTVSTALRAQVTRLLALPPGAFRPAPKVRSAVVRLAFHPPPPGMADPELVVAVVRAVFTQRRKTLANALAPFASPRGRAATDVLAAAGIDGRRRPQTLTLEEYGRIAAALSA